MAPDRTGEPRPPVRDVRFSIVTALVLGIVGVLGTIGAGGFSGVDKDVDRLAIGLVLAAAATAGFRRRAPVITLAVVTVLLTTYLVLAYPYGPVFFPFFVAVYTVAAYRPLAVGVPSALAALALLLVHVFTHPAAIQGFLSVVPASAWVAVPFAIGTTVRLTREARQREQAEAVRDRVYEERLRIAQEVHDVVGHGLAAIKMQADVALHLMAKKPEQAEEALTAISRTSTEALDEVRATLAVVRGSGPERTAPPSLDRLDDLRKRMAEAGMMVGIDTTGTPRSLPARVESAAYRIVQESLTNALRHGERKIAAVRVTYDTAAVVIEVSNPAVDVVAERIGFGIQGMSERVTALGGEFFAGPTGSGRFEVRATLPTGAAS